MVKLQTKLLPSHVNLFIQTIRISIGHRGVQAKETCSNISFLACRLGLAVRFIPQQSGAAISCFY